MERLEERIERTDGDDEAMLLEQLMFRDIMDEKINVKTKCHHCEGRGEKHGEPCPVCDGERIVYQWMSIHKIAKKIVPVLVYELSKAAKDSEQPRHMTAGG